MDILIKTKICIDCGEKKEIEDYSLHSSTGKRRNVCIFCSKKKKKEHTEKNKEKISSYQKEWAEENKKARYEYGVRYREEKGESLKLKKKEYRNIFSDEHIDIKYFNSLFSILTQIFFIEQNTCSLIYTTTGAAA